MHSSSGREFPDSWGAVRKWTRGLALGLVGLFAVILLFSCWFTVDAGERAVVLRFGAIRGVVGEGLHLKFPMIERLVRIDVRIAKHTTSSEASSKDLQVVHTEIALNYRPEADLVGELYQRIGLQWEERIITPAINETFKAITARYTAEELITKRNEVSHNITEALGAKLQPYGLLVESNGVNITDFDFSQEFNKAIEEKVTAEQRALKAARDLDRIKLEAEQAVATAEGQARALRAQRLEVTPELIRLREVENQRLALERWNGQLPQFVGSDAIPFISMQREAK